MHEFRCLECKTRFERQLFYYRCANFRCQSSNVKLINNKIKIKARHTYAESESYEDIQMPEGKKQKKLRDMVDEKPTVAGKLARRQRSKEKMIKDLFDDNTTSRYSDPIDK